VINMSYNRTESWDTILLKENDWPHRTSNKTSRSFFNYIRYLICQIDWKTYHSMSPELKKWTGVLDDSK
jgi:hypothetical protein